MTNASIHDPQQSRQNFFQDRPSLHIMRTAGVPTRQCGAPLVTQSARQWPHATPRNLVPTTRVPLTRPVTIIVLA
ncbi:hypothetical protein RRG08_062047 [Elysia crispata]|uniref:Uncharacterized protein n=1 Tax=Elysia crispata TaxID=231223 RepID=A0AAE1A4B2_9GAST|nr:hypothetical protein RRG08_062047 [Elysia crispata]